MVSLLALCDVAVSFPNFPLVPRVAPLMSANPMQRYPYWSPGGVRGRPMATSPFESVWHLNLGEHKAALAGWRGTAASKRCKLLRSFEALLASAQAAQVVRTPKRPNPKARKRAGKRLAKARGRDG